MISPQLNHPNRNTLKTRTLKGHSKCCHNLQGDVVNNSNPISLINEFGAFLKLKEQSILQQLTHEKHEQNADNN